VAPSHGPCCLAPGYLITESHLIFPIGYKEKAWCIDR
jgi:hypothetical protein